MRPLSQNTNTNDPNNGNRWRHQPSLWPMDALAYTEGDSATVIDSTLTITDVDDTNIESATVTISSGYQSSEDVLAFSSANGITGS